MKIAAFDLEIGKTIDDFSTWRNHRPLGITCAAIYKINDDGETSTALIAGNPTLSALACQLLLLELANLIKHGWTLVTVNGAGFDFDVLGEEGGIRDFAADVTRRHVDLNAIVIASKGHRLGLSAMAEGMGVTPKRKTVELSTGETLHDMDGAKAPELWEMGERDAVLTYLKDDVRSTAETAVAVARERKIRWTSRSGRRWVVDVPHLYTVDECLRLTPSIPHWLTNPTFLKDELTWMGEPEHA